MNYNNIIRLFITSHCQVCNFFNLLWLYTSMTLQCQSFLQIQVLTLFFKKKYTPIWTLLSIMVPNKTQCFMGKTCEILIGPRMAWMTLMINPKNRWELSWCIQILMWKLSFWNYVKKTKKLSPKKKREHKIAVRINLST